MDAVEYSDSIRIDKPKNGVNGTDAGRYWILRKKMLDLNVKHASLNGFWMLLSFFVLSQSLAYTRTQYWGMPYAWVYDISAMIVLAAYTYLTGTLLRRYVQLEVQALLREAREITSEAEDAKHN